MDHERSEPLPDLDVIAADLADVTSALARLEDGSYGADPERLPAQPPPGPDPSTES